MKLQKKDFIEIEFTGRVKDGEIFDSNIEKDLKEARLDVEAKPFVFCLGENMFLKGIDDFMIGKDMGSYEIELKPEDAFGPRNPKLIQMMPMKVFREQKINPVAGFMFNFDGRVAKILTVSGGRVMVDFNNPVAGKNVIYNLKVLKKIDNIDEKVKALNEFLFRKNLNYQIIDKKIVIEVEKQLAQFVELFKDKYKDILELDLEVKVNGEKAEENIENKLVENISKKVEEKKENLKAIKKSQ